MAYVKVGPWVNGAAPPISAANLDHVETQYDEAIATSPPSEWTDIAASEHDSAGGSGGWVETDISGDVPAGTVAVLVKMSPNTWAIQVGARSHGSARTDTINYPAINGIPCYTMCGVDAALHIDLYDDAQIAKYYIVAYLK